VKHTDATAYAGVDEKSYYSPTDAATITNSAPPTSAYVTLAYTGIFTTLPTTPIAAKYIANGTKAYTWVVATFLATSTRIYTTIITRAHATSFQFTTIIAENTLAVILPFTTMNAKNAFAVTYELFTNTTAAFTRETVAIRARANAVTRRSADVAAFTRICSAILAASA